MDHLVFIKTFLFILVQMSLNLFQLPFIVNASHSLYSALHHFETLHKVNDVHHRVVRDNMPHPKDNLRQIQFRTLGMDFRLLLSPHTRPFHPHAEVHSAGPTHSRKRINIHQFFHGHVIGIEISHVIAHVTDDGLITAVMMIGDHLYYVEPSFRHFSESHDFHMITYRGSDLKYNMTGKPNESFCGAVGSHYHHDDEQHYFKKIHGNIDDMNSIEHMLATSSASRNRLKRQTTLPDASKLCPVNIIATTSFYHQFGGSDEGHTINYILTVMLQIDAIFRSVEWAIPGVSNGASPGVRGLQIANITVLTNTGNSPEYNADQSWNSEELLNEFARTDWTGYCLSHLFTARPYSDSSTLGVAYTAFSYIKSGGVCAEGDKDDKGIPVYRNVGVSTYRASNRFLLLAESVVVTGHEFGHSWGSRHDVSTAECSPSNSKGGKYIMYAFAQDGEAPNNMRFSNCSRKAVSKVLGNYKREECFVKPIESRCGDFIIDDGEECDPGPTAILRGGDLCCTDHCTLKTASNGFRYNCSDSNHDCCIQCRPSPVGEVCHQQEVGNINCHGNRTCNGGITCPSEVVFTEEGAPCGILGQCFLSSSNSLETMCVNFCEQRNLTTCYCTGDEECSLCCMELSNGTCLPHHSNNFLPARSFCEGGSCDGMGVCIPSDPDLSLFLLTDFSTSTFGRFVRQNIVAAVLIVTLIFWIPLTIVVHLCDVYKDDQKEKNKKKTDHQKKRNDSRHTKTEAESEKIEAESEKFLPVEPKAESSAFGSGSMEPTSSAPLAGLESGSVKPTSSTPLAGTLQYSEIHQITLSVGSTPLAVAAHCPPEEPPVQYAELYIEKVVGFVGLADLGQLEKNPSHPPGAPISEADKNLVGSDDSTSLPQETSLQFDS